MASGKSHVLQPNQTLYVQNINDQVKKTELKRLLYWLFTQHGRVVDIVCLKTPRMRGQAHIVFQDVPQATAALRALQGFEFYGKPLRIAFAKTTSKIITMDSDYQEEQRMKALMEDHRQIMMSKQVDQSGQQMMEEDEKEPSSAKPVASAGAVEVEIELPPNKTLFAQNLPDTTTDQMLRHLFSQYPGFIGVRMVPGKHEFAFIDYATEQDAMAVKTVMDGFQITVERSLKLSFAKK